MSFQHHASRQHRDITNTYIYTCNSVGKFAVLAPVVRKVDSAIHRINLWPVDSAIGFRNTNPLDSDLSGG